MRCVSVLWMVLASCWTLVVHASPIAKTDPTSFAAAKTFCESHGMRLRQDGARGQVNLGGKLGKVHWVECQNSRWQRSSREHFVVKDFTQPPLTRLQLHSWHKQFYFLDLNQSGVKQLYVLPANRRGVEARLAAQWCGPYQNLTSHGFTGYVYGFGHMQLHGRKVRWVGCESSASYNSRYKLTISLLANNKNERIPNSQPITMTSSQFSGERDQDFEGWLDLNADGTDEWLVAQWNDADVWHATGLNFRQTKLTFAPEFKYSITKILTLQVPKSGATSKVSLFAVMNRYQDVRLVHAKQLSDGSFQFLPVTNKALYAQIKPQLLHYHVNRKLGQDMWAGLLCRADNPAELGQYFANGANYDASVRVAAAQCMLKKSTTIPALSEGLMQRMLADKEAKVRSALAGYLIKQEKLISEHLREEVVLALHEEQDSDAAHLLLKYTGCPTPERTLALIHKFGRSSYLQVVNSLHACLAATLKPQWYLKGLQLTSDGSDVEPYLHALQRRGLTPSDDNWGSIVPSLANYAEQYQQADRDDNRHHRLLVGVIARIRHPYAKRVLLEWMQTDQSMQAFYALSPYQDLLHIRLTWILEKIYATLSDTERYEHYRRHDYYRQLLALGTLDSGEARTVLRSLISTPTKRAPFGQDATAIEGLLRFPTKRSKQFLAERCTAYVNYFSDEGALNHSTLYQLGVICDHAAKVQALSPEVTLAYRRMIKEYKP